MPAPPMTFEWTGDSFAPIPAFAKLADRRFVVGDRYRLVEHEERSMLSHRHFFACIRTVHENLPARLVLQYPDPDILRKFALIRAGFCTVKTIVCASKAEAKRWARTFREESDGYVLISVEKRVVSIFKAKSQSIKAMGSSAEFQRSKDAVLQVLSEMIGTDAATLSHQSEAA